VLWRGRDEAEQQNGGGEEQQRCRVLERSQV